MGGRESGEGWLRVEVEEVVEEGKWVESGRRSMGPPSIERWSWIFVSLVLRSMNAVRVGRALDAMAIRGTGRVDWKRSLKSTMAELVRELIVNVYLGVGSFSGMVRDPRHPTTGDSKSL